VLPAIASHWRVGAYADLTLHRVRGTSIGTNNSIPKSRPRRLHVAVGTVVGANQ
jgi:hypothetical protein